MVKHVTCNKCGWCYFEVSRDHVKKWVDEWQVLFDTKPKEWLAMYGITDKPPSTEPYYACGCGNSYKQFHDSLPAEVPRGSTISPILGREYEPV